MFYRGLGSDRHPIEVSAAHTLHGVTTVVFRLHRRTQFTCEHEAFKTCTIGLYYRILSKSWRITQRQVDSTSAHEPLRIDCNDIMAHSPVTALSRRSSFYRRVATRLRIRQAHSAVIDHYLSNLKADSSRPEQLVFVEVGAGLTTGAIAGHARRLNAIFYTCDINEQLLGEIASNLAPGTQARLAPGDSVAVLPRIAAEIDRVDFAYLDSAPSALRTFREFQILEPLFRPGSVVILDNASLPGAWFTFSPCRKGRILVPYLLASPLWEVIPWPHDGDSMIAAIRHVEPRWSHPNYELSDYRGDNWRRRIPAKQQSAG